jgi:catechol 2,3-dioxygenase-like lactoylglutathione lyase family enzyme
VIYRIESLRHKTAGKIRQRSHSNPFPVALPSPVPIIACCNLRTKAWYSALCGGVKGENSMATQSSIRGLGEVALRVADLDRMQDFYQHKIGLELLRRADRHAFFRLGDGYGGHTQVLALFDRSAGSNYTGLNSAKSTVDHLAFEISLGDYERERRRLTELGLTVTTAEHGWVHWRSLYVDDPEGNTVELVCYDPSVVERTV